jgi:hypothetical protein
MSLSVKLQRRSVIADIGNLLEVRREERADRLECLVLLDVGADYARPDD